MNGLKEPAWYIAELVILYDVRGAKEDLLHIDAKLIKACSSEEAFEKASNLGERYNYTFMNTDNETVHVSFLGLRELIEVAEDLEDGCELFYQEIPRQKGEETENPAKPKEALAVFRFFDSKQLADN